MKNIDWYSLRTLKGSQSAAFEELCCQLAAFERMPKEARFTRVGAPDAGVECYWTLPEGAEHSWQAKFFLTPPHNNQWGEIDGSIKTALEKHPHLVSYTVCFPLDRQDPRIDEQQWFMNKWMQHVKTWERWAQAKGMTVTFKYWGEHEFLLRLSHEDHRGRSHFWFDQELFSNYWFQQHFDEALSACGARYTPNLNVTLPIARVFDSLGRTMAFFERFDIQVRAIKQAYSSLSEHFSKARDKSKVQRLQHYMQTFVAGTQIDQKDVHPIDWVHLEHASTTLYRETKDWRNRLVHPASEEERNPLHNMEDSQHGEHRNFFLSDLYQLLRSLEKLQESLEEDKAWLTNIAALLLIGEAGSGKTHLLCDIAQMRLKQGSPTILLLGGLFRNSEPWTQIHSLLSLSGDRNQFLGALNAAGEARQQRALILIDALNEGEGKHLWHDFLPGILTTIARYPWLGLALSLRSSYEEMIIPGGLIPAQLIRVVHHGFINREHEATKTYFDYYGIERPSIPLLLSEFRNPLFLRLFCQGLEAGNYTRIPEGLQGITAIFDFFLEKLNEKITGLQELDLNPHVPYLHRAVRALAQELAKREVHWLPQEDAQKIVDQIAPPKSYEYSLFRRLIHEGVLAEDRYPIPKEQSHRSVFVDGIRFTYERLSDHIIAEYLLDEYLDPDDSLKAFEQNGSLERLISSKQAQQINRGLIESFSIQLPERIGKELCEVASWHEDDEIIRKALVESLLWRHPDSITRTTHHCLSKHVLCYSDTFQQFLCVVLTVAMNPRHPFNADFLHSWLLKYSMAERDEWWSLFLSEQYNDGNSSPVNRLIDWGWKGEGSGHVEDNAVRLAGVALCWFLTTSHRFLRDRATKALIRLFENRLLILQHLLDAFAEVDDPYISERLYAVVYGCVMRSQNMAQIQSMAQKVYDHIFKQDQPPSHILLRDYARGIVERALALNLTINIQPDKIRPPYPNTWPTDFPSQVEIDQLVGTPQEEKRAQSLQERGRFYLRFSMMAQGDFARYVIGSDAISSKWSSRRLTDPYQPTVKERYRQFVTTLTPKQQQAVEQFRTLYQEEYSRQFLREFNQILQMGNSEENAQNEEEANEEVQQKQTNVLEEAEQHLQQRLGKRKAAQFEKLFRRSLERPEKGEESLDLDLFRRWILRRVFELGWTMERFGKFDALVDREGVRTANKKVERIGKKYQWIAYYDILARASDTFAFKDDYWEEENRAYEGPWQIGAIRNLDPSFLLEKTCSTHGNITLEDTWWCLPSPEWQIELNDQRWLDDKASIPDPHLLIEVLYPKENSAWLTLYGHYIWKQPPQPEEEKRGTQGREIWYFLESFLVKRSDVQQLFAWARLQDFLANPLPGSRDWDEIYFGELYWSPCYQYYASSSLPLTEWTRGEKNMSPVPLTLTVETYHWSAEYDCSIEDTLHCAVPSRYLQKNMKLQWNGKDGHYITSSGESIAFDPSVSEIGPSVLLLRKDALLQFLTENDLTLVWTIRGEKRIYRDDKKASNMANLAKLTGAYLLTTQGNLQGEMRCWIPDV